VQYYLGLGVERDLERAAKLFETAAVGGHAGAQRNLGIMYLRGFGVPQDKVRAYSWFYQSTEQGDPHAFKYLDFVADYITPNQSMVARRWVTKFMRDAGS
jgi:TPR repeat protein